MDDEQPSETPSSTDAAEIAARIARESKDAVPGGPKVSPSTATPPTGPVDSWGRPFDPALHLTKMDNITPALRGGKLICKKGQSLSAPRVRAASPAAAGDAGSLEEQHRIGLEALGGGAPDDVPAGSSDVSGIPATGDPAPMAPEEFTRQAQARARAARKITGKLGRLLGGQAGEFKDIDGANEGQDIEDATLDAQTEYQKLLPVGSVLTVLMAYGSYAYRVAVDARRKSKEAENAKKQGRPIEKTQDQPVESTDQPSGPPRGTVTADLGSAF